MNIDSDNIAFYEGRCYSLPLHWAWASKEFTGMRCRSPISSTLIICLAFSFVFSVYRLAAADSIVVNGKRYDDIYVGVGTQVYYIQDPADGSMIEVPKSTVREKDITITPDREARRKLRDQWRMRRMNKTIETPATSLEEQKPAAALKNVPNPAKSTAAEQAPPPPARKQESKPVEKPIVISGFGLEE